MTLVTPSQSNPGDTIDASDINNPVNQIAAVVNGNIDSTNIATNGVGPSNIATNAVQADDLATGAITLGYAQITTSSSANNTATQALVTGLSVTVTIPAGGRKIKITAFCSTLSNGTVNGQSLLSIWDGTVGSGTQLQQATAINNGNAGIGGAPGVVAIAVVTPSAGSKTYNVGYSCVAGSNTIVNASGIQPAFILVEAI